jgi:hypothetical protein
MLLTRSHGHYRSLSQFQSGVVSHIHKAKRALQFYNVTRTHFIWSTTSARSHHRTKDRLSTSITRQFLVLRTSASMPLTLTSDLSIVISDPAFPTRYPVPLDHAVDYPTASCATYAETVTVSFILTTRAAEGYGITTLRLGSGGIRMELAPGVASGQMIADGSCDGEPYQRYDMQRYKFLTLLRL